MKIIVLIKEVPDMERVLFDRERGVVDRASASAEINPFDLYALQAAVDLKKIHGGHITAVSMGPERCTSSLKDAYARGADSCVCVTDKNFAGADTLVTSRVLAAAISRLEYDLIICGEKTVDGDTAQVGAEVAELLNIPHSYYVEEISKVESGHISVFTSEINGSNQARRMKLPALISVVRHIAKPLLPPLKRKLDSVSIDIKKIGANELNIPEENAGLKGSPTRVSKIVIPKAAVRKCEIFRDDLNAFIQAVKPFAKRKAK